MKTVRQAAAELGVSRQAIYKRVPSLSANMVTTYGEGLTMITPEGLAFLKGTFSPRQTSDSQKQTSDSTVDTLVAMLQKELDAKNRLIEELTADLREARADVRAAQALHAGTIQKQITDGKRPGFFNRLFHKD